MEQTLSNDIQFTNMDTWHGGSKYGLSFKQIVLQHINRCVINSSKEMIKGFWETRRDKWGNEIRSYHPDTRHEFINTIETLKNILLPNIDEKAEKELKQCYGKINETKVSFINFEKKSYMNLSHSSKQKIVYMEGCLNQDGIYYHQFINLEVDVYRKIFEILIELAGRLNFFEEEEVEDEIGGG